LHPHRRQPGSAGLLRRRREHQRHPAERGVRELLPRLARPADPGAAGLAPVQPAHRLRDDRPARGRGRLRPRGRG
jgi:hypothetical protein